jgi:hypothetical protein
VKPLRRCRSRRHRCAESASPAVWACEFQRRDHADRGIGLLKSRRTMLAYADDWTRCQGFKLVCVSIVTHCCSAKSCRLREEAARGVARRNEEAPARRGPGRSLMEHLRRVRGGETPRQRSLICKRRASRRNATRASARQRTPGQVNMTGTLPSLSGLGGFSPYLFRPNAKRVLIGQISFNDVRWLNEKPRTVVRPTWRGGHDRRPP